MTADGDTWGGGLWAAADLVTPMAIRVAATLRIAEHIAAGATTSAQLAAITGCDLDALDRLLRHLITAAVLTLSDSDDFGLTPLGEQLRDAHPSGVRGWLDLTGAVGRGDLSLVHLLDTVCTAKPAYPLQFGRGFWDDLGADSALSESFDALMGAQLADEAPLIARCYDWGALRHVVDVGGNNGVLLAALLADHAQLRGTVLDLAAPVAAAQRFFDGAGVADRARAVEGSFFDGLPEGAGGYVLSGVLSDWDDEAALRILQRCAEAAGKSGRVLVVDGFGAAGAAVHGTEMDLRMLAYFAGRTRDLDQVTALAAAVGLEQRMVVHAERRTVVEFGPADWC